MRSNTTWRARGPQTEHPHPSKAVQPLPVPHAGDRAVPSPRDALCTAIRQAWGVQKGAGPTSRDSRGGRKPLKAPASPSSVFSSQAHLFCTATDHRPLPPAPSSPHSPGTVPAHPATPPPGQQQDTWPAEQGAQGPRGLPCGEGGSCRGHVGAGRAPRREAGAAWGRLPRTQVHMSRVEQPGKAPLAPPALWLLPTPVNTVPTKHLTSSPQPLPCPELWG